MDLLFEDRFVIEKGTVYQRFLGDSDTMPKEVLNQQIEMLKQFVGKTIKVNGKESNLLDVIGESRCNLVNRRYYICVLTDEEFKIKEPNYSI